MIAVMDYRISERDANGAQFSYSYRAEGYSDAIAQWVRATFCKGCTFSEPDNAGGFYVDTPKGMRVRATVTRA